MIRRILPLFLLTFLCGADDTPTVLADTVITASRSAQSEQETPYATSALQAEEMQLERAVRTVPEALKAETGVMIQKTGHGQGSPYIRGFTSQRTLFMIDGVRLNNSVFRDGPNQYWNTVDALSLARLELVRGPAAVLYGSDAVGGTVQAVTRGQDQLAPDEDWQRRLYVRYASAEDSLVLRGDSIAALSDRVTLTLGYTLKEFGDLEGGRDVGTQQKTGYDERDWDAKVELALSDNVALTVAHQTVRIDDAWRTHKTVYGTTWRGLSVGSELRRVLDQERSLSYLQLAVDDGPGFVDELHAGVSLQRQLEDRDRLRTGDRHDQQGFEVQTLGGFVTLHTATAVGDLTYGVEAYHDEVSSFKRKLDAAGTVTGTSIQGPVADDATYDTVGLHLQDRIALNERWSLTLGARYERSEADAHAVEDPNSGEKIQIADSWSDVVGSARLQVALREDRSWIAYGGISQGFRSPNLSDLTRLDSARTDEIETPSPNLDPEHYTSFELGVKAETERYSLQLACFYTGIDGMIVRTPTGQIVDGDFEVTKRNAGDGQVHGVEFDGAVDLAEKWSVFGAVTWLDGDVESYPTSDAAAQREYLDRLMPLTGRLGVRWEARDNWWISVVGTAAADADRLSTRDRGDTSRIPPGGTPGYAVLDLRAAWEATEHLTITAAVENLEDLDYRVHGSGLNESGRNLVLAAELKF